MSIKKLRNQLFAAIAMVLVASIALGSSTYAWFASNNSVKATGMTIAATSDAEFLTIVEGGIFDSTSQNKSVASIASIKLLPTAPVSGITSSNVEDKTSWHYAYSNDPTKTKGDSQDLSYIVVTGELIGDGKYLGKETFSIGLNDKAGVSTSATALQLQNVQLAADTGVSCVVVCGEHAYTYTTDSSVPVEIATNATTTGSVVDVYYYINGNDDNVFTNNISSLHGTVILTFGLAA